MADSLYVQVYPGCEVKVDDPVAFARNPLMSNPLVWLKDDDALGRAHRSSDTNRDVARIDFCVRCHPYGFGDLCDEHRDELAEVET
jgi:hypothetical protein